MNTKFPISFFILFVLSGTLLSAPLSGSYNVGSGQTYTTLTKNNGFFGDVNSNGLSGNVTVYITSDLSEDGTKALNQWTEVGVGGYTITIKPSSNVVRTISMNSGKPLLLFNGVDRVTIDGRYNGSGSYLLFRNTNGLYPVLQFQNDASNNTITYCTLESNNQSALGSSGTVVFSTTTGTQGNDSNTISYCTIRDRSDASGTSLCAIFANGTTTSSSRYNSYNTITNCNIFNTFSSTSTFVDMYLGDGNSNWVITNNSFYQSAARVPSITSAYFGMIMATTGDNNLVSGNYFGGTAPQCGGGAMVFTGGGGLFGFRIWQVGTTTTSTIQNNTVANIDYTLSASGDYFFFKGIETNVSGKVDLIGNTVGSTSSSSSIVLRYNGASGSPYPAAINYGYYWLGVSTCTGSVSNNTVGGISLTGSGTTNGNMTFSGIIAGFDPTLYNGIVTISGNTIGNNLTSNFQNVLDIRTTFCGISTNVASTGSATVTNNTIRNLTDGTSNGSAVLRGIMHDGTGNFTATGNTIYELNTTAVNVNGVNGGNVSNSVAGILTGSSATGTVVISGNIVHGLRSNYTGNSNTSAKGICLIGTSPSGTISGNKIYDITNLSTGAGPAIYGLYYYNGTYTVSNNIVGITNGEATERKTGTVPIPGINQPMTKNAPVETNSGLSNSITGITASVINHSQQDNVQSREESDAVNGMIIQGIHDESAGTMTLYYNTIYIGGSATNGSNISSAYTRDFVAHPVTMKDNLFYNGRTGNGTHVAVNNNISGSTFTSNYNVFISSNLNTAARWVGTNRTIAQWRTSSGGDNQTWSTLSTSLNASNLFLSIGTGDFRINSANSEAWIVSGKGIAINGFSTDIEGNARSTTIAGGTTDIGANEFAATPPSNPSATVDFAPGSGVTSTYSLWGRTIAVINWGTGGTSYPSSLSIQYYSGVNPPNVLGGNFSNSYWSVTPTGILANTSYDITYSFGDNETFTINTPNTSTRLAKYNTSWEVFSTSGTGIYQTELNWANLTLKTRGVYNFSVYALTDVNSPLPVTLKYFTASSSARLVHLSWATETETNNSGFNVERRSVLSDNNTTGWQTVGFVRGNGTTTTETDYTFNDDKLVSGTYQYRLKQIDFNGNYEYYVLNSPSNVTIGTPVIFGVTQNYPNPSNPVSKIDYQIPFDGKVSMKVYDIAGKEVATLVNSTLNAGYYTSTFDGTNLSSGVYFYRIIAEGNGQKFADTKKMILVK